VGARAERDPELAREVVAGEPGERFQLARAHDARALGVEELARPLDGAGIHAALDRGRRAAALAGDQAFGESHDERVDRERVQRTLEGRTDGPRQRRVA